MKAFNKSIGTYGEELAIQYLKENLHIILECNFKTKYGEIDIISTYNNIIIFTEVKSRYSTTYGNPLEAVTYSKQQKIIKLSLYYLLHKNLSNYNVRYDVIEVFFNKTTDTHSINHLPDAYRLF